MSFSTRGRGLKFCVDFLRRSEAPVALTRGAWIEIRISRAGGAVATLLSPPTRGAWIEICHRAH